MTATHATTVNPSANKALEILLTLTERSALERVKAIKRGLDPTVLNSLGNALRLSQAAVFEMLGLKRSTVHRRINNHESLNVADSERVLGLGTLMAIAYSYRDFTEDPDQFDPGHWLSDWLQQANPALGGACPSDLMDTLEGQELVIQLLRQIGASAYA